MSYTRRTVLSDGLTNVVVDLPEKEIERIQTETTSEDMRSGSEGPFDRRRKSFKAPWDAEMTRFFITEYRSVRGIMTKKREAFLHISDKMNQRGYDVTPYTVEKKWHNLIKTYKNVLDRAIHKGEEKICWEFFEDMDEIIKNSTPALPAPGNLQALAKSRKVYPNSDVSPSTVPETISVSPDFLPCPPSPELIITTSHSSSSPPPTVEGANTSSPAFNMSTLLSSAPSRPHVLNNSVSCVGVSSHSSLHTTETQNSSTAHFSSDTSSQTQTTYSQNQIVSTASWPVHASQPQTSTVTNLPNNTTHLTSTYMQSSNMTPSSLSNGYASHIQTSTYSKAIEPHQQPHTQAAGIIKNESDNEVFVHNSCKKRKWEEGLSCHTVESEGNLLAVQREMNAHLRTLNSNILAMGHTLNENIVGLKRAVESMVSIMLQNKASA
ncbi:mucin-17 isoform X2 [Procambarus clarkii]|uniref:mucin-17 isoform X2 n=1 Tax=Procambarus clarkii TaxID=6728 RepID=UPI0037433ACF